MTWIAAWWLRRQHPQITIEAPTVEPKVTLYIRLDPELHARLKKAAEERLVSVTWLTNRAIEHFLDNLLPPDEFTLTK